MSDRAIWQVAAGDTKRNYVDLCLRCGVILNGPGDAGPWPDCANELRERDVSERKISDIRRFCEEIKDGDLVVLRLGTRQIFGIGKVAGDYQWNDHFGDIDGWRLQHVRRVRWLWKNLTEPEEFDTFALKFGDTTQRLDREEVITWVYSAINFRSQPDLPELPPEGEENISPLSLEELGEFLFDHGIGAISISSLIDQIADLTRFSRWYQKYGMPSESETVAHLVVPLLRTLGWTPQRMALEWNRIDVALFESVPREDQTLSAVVEVKPVGESCITAKSQAQNYAKDPNRTACQRLIVTDGLRYGIYPRQQAGTFKEHPSAYLNLAKLKPSYPVLGCDGASHAMLLMSSGWQPT